MFEKFRTLYIFHKDDQSQSHTLALGGDDGSECGGVVRAGPSEPAGLVQLRLRSKAGWQVQICQILHEELQILQTAETSGGAIEAGKIVEFRVLLSRLLCPL